MFGFLIALCAGYVTPQLQSSLVPQVSKTLAPLKITEAEWPVVAFMLALLGAAIAAMILNSGSTLGVSLGVCIGYFGPRLINIVKDATSGKPSDD